MKTFSILFIVFAPLSAAENDLRDFSGKVHEAQREFVMSTEGFDSFNSKKTPFLFIIDNIDESKDDIKISGLATLPIPVDISTDQLDDNSEYAHRFNGVYKNGVFNVSLQHRLEQNGITVTVTLYGKIENGRCRGYFVDAYERSDGTQVKCGGLFEIGRD